MKFRKYFFYTVTTILMLAASISVLVFITIPKVGSLPPLQTGDIVFQTGRGPQAEMIMLGTSSLITHMGIVRVSRSGQPIVIEAADPVTQTPLPAWIEKGLWGRLKIMRPYNFPADEGEKVIEATKPFFGRRYDPYFSADTDRIYSSELVYRAYDSIGIALGSVQKVADLPANNILFRNLAAPYILNHPACRQAASIDICWQILLQEDVITPRSIARDSRLEVIYSNYFPPEIH
jgi:hypothetical protein